MQPAISISVVMCTYNGAAFIEAQFQSIIAQTYPLKELLIFDDASADGTAELIKKLAEPYSFVRLFVNPANIGFTKNFEQALRMASGDVIALSDQDDIWLPQKLEKMIAAWKPGCPLIYCDSILFSGTPPQQPVPHRKFRRFEGTDARKIFLRNTVSGHAMLIRKSFLPLVLPFEEGIVYDWHMAVTAACNGGVQHFPEVLVLQRMHANNITVSAAGRAARQTAEKEFVTAHCRAFLQNTCLPAAQRSFLQRFYSLMHESRQKTFHMPLFAFLMRYRRLLFHYKRRKLGTISHLKHSYRITKG